MNNILTRKACLLFFISLSLFIFGCGSGGDGSNQNSVSLVGWEQECGSRSKSENIIQNAAIGDFTCCLNVGIYVLWNWMTGSYKPYPNRPISMPTWPTSYTHSSWPMLSFAHPPDWTPNEFTVPNELIGVELVRNDIPEGTFWSYQTEKALTVGYWLLSIQVLGDLRGQIKSLNLS